MLQSAAMAGNPKRRAFLNALAETTATATGDATDDAIDEWLIEQVTAGDTAITICRTIEASPAWQASGYGPLAPGMLYKWLSRNPDINERYSRARVQSSHAFADRAAAVGVDVNEATARAAAVRLKAYQWNAERRNREAYGAAPTNVINNMDIGTVYLQVLKLRAVSPSLPSVDGDATGGQVIEATAAGRPAIEPPPFEPRAAVVEDTGTPPASPSGSQSGAGVSE